MKHIELTRGAVTIVDDADYEALSRHSWYLHNGYAYGRPGGRAGQKIRMHRYILGVDPLAFVDHINGDKLDNRRENLREVTKRQNNCNARVRSDNRARLKGVSKTRGGLWRARAWLHGRARQVDGFRTKVAAAIEYNIMCVQMHGEHARPNAVFSGDW